MTTAGTIAGGLLLIVLAGVLNGSWNASFSPNANLAVGKSTKPETKGDDEPIDEPAVAAVPHDLSYHHAFALFQFYAVLINIPICIFWAGGAERVGSILSETSAVSIVLVIVFSMIWGVGTLLFGLACKIAGVGLGTNLSMGIIAVIGTFLPLITEKTLLSPAGAVICVGLAICCVGLWIATKALSKRDEDESVLLAITSMGGTEKKEQDSNTFLNEDLEAEGDNTKRDNPKIVTIKETNDEKVDDNELSLRRSRYMYARRFTASFRKTPERKEQENKDHPTWMKILVCVATGVCAVQLQFAFIFGAPISDLATGSVDDDDIILPGSTPEGGGAAIIWLLAISVGAPISIINGIWSSPVPISSSLRAPWWRHLRLICTTSLPWISHIHIYGVCATTLLPEKVAASIGWPLLMMTTSAQALILSMFLGEWKAASSDTIRTLMYSIGVTLFGIVVLMTSVAVPTST
jgi:hypothetical protein